MNDEIETKIIETSYGYLPLAKDLLYNMSKFDWCAIKSDGNVTIANWSPEETVVPYLWIAKRRVKKYRKIKLSEIKRQKALRKLEKFKLEIKAKINEQK